MSTCDYNNKTATWIQILVGGVIILFAASILLYVVGENRRNDVEYFKGRLAALETRMNNTDARVETLAVDIKRIGGNIADISNLTVQINSNVIENSRRLEEILNPPKPLKKTGRPKSAFKPEKLVAEPVIQGPKPVPPVRGPGIPHTGGRPIEPNKN